MRNHRLAKTDAGHFQLFKLFRRQLGVPFRQEADRFIHPFHLIIRCSADHSALPDGTKQFIPSAIGY